MDMVDGEDRPQPKRPLFDGFWSKPAPALTASARNALRDGAAQLEFEQSLAELERRVPATPAERLRAAARLLKQFRPMLTADQIAMAEAILAAAGAGGGGRSKQRGQGGTGRPSGPQPVR